MTQSSDAVDLDVIEKKTAEPANEFLSSMGARFKLKRVSALIVTEAVRALKPPPVPKVLIRQEGEPDRWDENPNDPDYVVAMEQFNFERGLLTGRVYFGFGTEILQLPSGMSRPEDDDWAELLEELTGLKVPAHNDKPRQRYVQWMKFVACGDQDYHNLIMKIMRYSGSTVEVDVAQAVESFRSQQTRDTTSGVPSPEEG